MGRPQLENGRRGKKEIPFSRRHKLRSLPGQPVTFCAHLCKWHRHPLSDHGTPLFSLSIMYPHSRYWQLRFKTKVQSNPVAQSYFLCSTLSPPHYSQHLLTGFLALDFILCHPLSIELILSSKSEHQILLPCTKNSASPVNQPQIPASWISLSSLLLPSLCALGAPGLPFLLLFSFLFCLCVLRWVFR